MEELLKQMEAQAKKDVAALLKNQVALAFEVAVAQGASKLKEAIKGPVDDAVIDLILPAIVPVLKAELVKAIEQLEA